MYNLRTLIERCIKCGKNISVSLTMKMHVRFKHKKIIECMEDLNIDGKYISLIRNLYWSQTAYMTTEGGLSQKFTSKDEYDKAVLYHHVCIIWTQKTYLEQLTLTKAYILVEQESIICATLMILFHWLKQKICKKY